MSSKDSKTREERIFEMYIKNYISETRMYEMLERIKKSK